MLFLQRKVLKKINRLCKSSSSTDSQKILLSLHTRIEPSQLISVISQLVDGGYITANFYMPLFADEIIPTFKGTIYESSRRKEIRDIFIKSFFLPLLVALITSLVTLWANGLLPVK